MAEKKVKSILLAAAAVLAICLAMWQIAYRLLDRAIELPSIKLPPAAAGTMDFRSDIRPIFAEKCYSCHGPKSQQAQLRLDEKTSVFSRGGRPSVIVKGDARGSRLIQRVALGEMPPQRNEKLTEEEMARLIAWIDQGAVWPDEEPEPEK